MPSHARRERPCGRATEQRDELASLQVELCQLTAGLGCTGRDRQGLGAGLNCSESEGAPSCGGQMARAR